MSNRRRHGLPKPSGLTVPRVMALSRVFLDNFPHVKAYWQMLVTQVAQSFGPTTRTGR